MKGLILSGGYGTRLRPLTHSQQKQLIPVANKPILFYAIEDVIEALVREIGIVIGSNKEQVITTVKSAEWNADITFIYQDEPKGIAHAVKISKDFIGDEPFILYLGDNILKEGIMKHAEEFKKQKPDASVLLTHVSNPQQFGVAELDSNNNVKRFIEKPKRPPSDLALVGVYFFAPTIFKAIEHLKPSWRGQLEITDAIQWLIDNGYKINATIVKDWWKDTGKVEDVLEANRLVLDDLRPFNKGTIESGALIQGRVSVDEGTIILKGSVLKGPVIVGKDCTIGPATYIGPYTSIGDNCEIIGAEVESSIVMNNTTINCKKKIVDSLIGTNVKISESAELPKGYRFVLGDSSDVRI